MRILQHGKGQEFTINKTCTDLPRAFFDLQLSLMSTEAVKL